MGKEICQATMREECQRGPHRTGLWRNKKERMGASTTVLERSVRAGGLGTMWRCWHECNGGIEMSQQVVTRERGAWR
jgi:hypothetical protein